MAFKGMKRRSLLLNNDRTFNKLTQKLALIPPFYLFHEISATATKVLFQLLPSLIAKKGQPR